jgi:hypothetical protein
VNFRYLDATKIPLLANYVYLEELKSRQLATTNAQDELLRN